MQPGEPLKKILRVMSLRVYISGHFRTEYSKFGSMSPISVLPAAPSVWPPETPTRLCVEGADIGPSPFFLCVSVGFRVCLASVPLFLDHPIGTPPVLCLSCCVPVYII